MVPKRAGVSRRPEGRRKETGGRGDSWWRRRVGNGLYFLEKGQRQRARDNDLDGGTRTRTIQFLPSPPLSLAPSLALIVKNIGPSGQFESSFFLRARSSQGPSIGSWPKKGSNLLGPSNPLLAENYVTPSRPVLCSRVSNRVRNREPREPLVCEEARGKNTGTRRCR